MRDDTYQQLLTVCNPVTGEKMFTTFYSKDGEYFFVDLVGNSLTEDVDFVICDEGGFGGSEFNNVNMRIDPDWGIVFECDGQEMYLCVKCYGETGATIWKPVPK